MYVTLIGAVFGLSGPSHQQLLGGWNFAVRFGRETLCCLDVASCAAQRLRPKRSCRVEGSQLDDLLLVYGLLPVLEADLRAALRAVRD